MPKVTITSFGYPGGKAPEAHLTLDLSTHFRHLTPTAQAVNNLVASTTVVASAYLEAHPTADLSIAIGSDDGQLHAPTIATALGVAINRMGHPVWVVHRDQLTDAR